MSLAKELADRLGGSVVVVGIGNPLRGDDAAGCEVARRLQGRSAALVVNAEEIPESHLVGIAAARPDTVLFVDAVDLGAAPGSLAMVEAQQMGGYCPSTHRMPLGLLMECLRRDTAADVFLVAVQPGRIGFGEPMSAEVTASITLLIDTLEGLLPAPPAGAGSPGTAKLEGRTPC
ncbi:MAG: hydrogenase maturation protease [Gemmatimonadota bacterium]|nr:MAG: hydrogenase maturation protease [Gemmatimonadota bacterium]